MLAFLLALVFFEHEEVNPLLKEVICITLCIESWF